VKVIHIVSHCKAIGMVILYIIFSTEDGVPYTVQIFAENSAGNGTVCNVTDFTNELGESFFC